MSFKLTSQISDQCKKKILTEIWMALAEAFKNSATTHEPQLIANLAYFLSKRFNKNISKILSKCGIQAGAGSVFVHSQPKVESTSFPKPGSVEIGDLLLLMTYKNKNSNNIPDRQSMLLQAKKCGHDPRSCRPGNDNQHYLYAHWPEFQYVRSRQLSGQRRHVLGSHHDGAKYLLIGADTQKIFQQESINNSHCGREENINSSCPVLTAQATIPLSGYRCFVNELYEFFFGRAGRSFIYKPSNGSRDWDQVITDLMDVTAMQVSTHLKKTGDPTGKRGQGIVSLIDYNPSMLAGGLSLFGQSHINNFSDLNGPPKIISDEKNTYGEEGITIIEFIMEESI